MHARLCVRLSTGNTHSSQNIVHIKMYDHHLSRWCHCSEMSLLQASGYSIELQDNEVKRVTPHIIVCISFPPDSHQCLRESSRRGNLSGLRLLKCHSEASEL